MSLVCLCYFKSRDGRREELLEAASKALCGYIYIQKEVSRGVEPRVTR